MSIPLRGVWTCKIERAIKRESDNFAKRQGILCAYVLRGDIKIPHSRMIKTCWEILVTSL